MPLEHCTNLRKWNIQELNVTNHHHHQAQLFSSTCSSPVLDQQQAFATKLQDNNRHQQQQPHHISWAVLIGVFIIQVFVSSVLASHGLIISHLLLHQSDEASYRKVFLPPAVFSATWTFVEPWCRSVGVRHRGGDSRFVAAVGVLLLATSLAASSLTSSAAIRILTFGLVGGAGCGMAVSQCDTQLTMHSTTGRPRIGLCVNMMGQALAQFMAPLVLVALLAGYGVSGASLIQAALVLHGLVGALLLRAVPRLRAILANAGETYMQMNTYISLPQNDFAEIETYLNDLDKEQQQDEDTCGDGRLRNDKGVEIMPIILEEEEDENSSVTSLRRSIRQSLRDSWCPVAPLEIYLPVQQDSTVKDTSPKPLITPSNMSTTSNGVFNFRSKSMLCCVTCVSWTSECVISTWRTLCKSMRELREVCKPALVPAMLMSSSVRLVPLGVASLTPTLAQEGLLLPRSEAAFALAMVGFGWFCVTAFFTPCFLTPTLQKQIPILYACASGLSALGLFFLSDPRSQDRLTLGCGIVGLTHGVIVLTCPHLLRRMYGDQESGSMACTSRASALLDRGAAVVIIVVALTFGLLAETVYSYSYVLTALATLQACLGAAWFAWILGTRIPRFCNVVRRSRIMRAPTVESINH